MNLLESLTEIIQLGSVHTSTEVSVTRLERFYVLEVGAFDVDVLGFDNGVPLTLPHVDHSVTQMTKVLSHNQCTGM